MEPFEIMVSESQERMLCVVEPAQLEAVLAVCARWEVHGTAIGEVTSTRRLRVFDGETLVGDMPVVALVDECPAYDLSPAEPSTPLYPAPPVMLSSSDPGELLVALLGSSNVASRKWAFEQYDSIVGSRTVRRPEQADAAVLLLPTPGDVDSLTSLYPSSNGAADSPSSRDRGRDRRQRAPRRRRSLPGHRRGGHRVQREPRLRRCRAAGPDQLPELRQPGEAAHRLAAHALDRRPRRCLPRVRHPGRGRQRVPVQRGRRGADLPDARRRPRRRAARRAARGPARVCGGRRRDRVGERGLERRLWRPRSSRSCAAKWSSGPCLPPTSAS